MTGDGLKPADRAGLGVRHMTAREIGLATAGLALRRRLFSGPDAEAEAIVDLICRLCSDGDDTTLDTRAAEALQGYERWAPTYDWPGNPLIAAEEAVVRPWVTTAPAGIAVDAGCGTGRWTRVLAEAGHRVIGVDQSPAMLGVARTALPTVRFLRGTLAAIPVTSAAADLTICALLLSHEADPTAAVRELARVTRPGGTVVISDLHPFVALLDGQAHFRDADGALWFVRSNPHLTGALLECFAAVGLRVRACVEPRCPAGANSIARQVARLPSMIADFAWEGLPLAVAWHLERER